MAQGLPCVPGRDMEPFKRRLRSKTKADECKEHADDKGVQRQLKCITGSTHELQCITDKTWLTAKQLEYKYKSEAHTQATDYMHRAKECGLVRINPETGCKEALYTNSTWKLLAPQRMRS